MVEVGDDDCRGEFLVFSEDEAVLDVLRFFEKIFYDLRSDVFTQGKFEYFLLAVRDLQILSVHQTPDVACMQKSVRVYGHPCRFRILVVSKHHVRAFCEYFPVIGKFQLCTFHRFPDCTYDVDPLCRIVHGNYR